MRKVIIIFSLSLFIAIQLNAQNTFPFPSSGNVGIGITNPAGTLHTERPVDSAGWGFITTSVGINNWSGFFVDSFNNFNIQARDGSGTMTANISSNGDSWLNGGNVGIGTTDTKDFKLGVQGKIAAEEVKVAVYSNWADFVFKSNYHLPTLIEVERHIKEKGHLKDIPSTEEVKENGIFLGEMDSKLLQKIEELTLYTINQEKRIKNLESKNETFILLVEKLLKKTSEE